MYWNPEIRRNELHINSVKHDQERTTGPAIQGDTYFYVNMGGPTAVNLVRFTPGRDANGHILQLPSAVNIYLRQNDIIMSSCNLTQGVDVDTGEFVDLPKVQLGKEVVVSFPKTAMGQFVEVQPVPKQDHPLPFPVTPILRTESFDQAMLDRALNTMKYLSGEVVLVYGDEPNTRTSPDEFAAAYEAEVRCVDSYINQHTSDYQNISVIKHNIPGLNALSNMPGTGGNWTSYLLSLLDSWKARNVPFGTCRLNMGIGDGTDHYIGTLTSWFSQYFNISSWILQSIYIGGASDGQWDPDPTNPVQKAIIQAFESAVNRIVATNEIEWAGFWRLNDSDLSDFSLQQGAHSSLGVLGNYYRAAGQR
jgi:hypothetical protein